ncbi:helix-turn-helix transcriptional regulator [Corynebacterium tuscaniense]|uniref:helix-turn-helix transcriptional regulator n=1 Tax=Corynebacterium tuscaniense TaxID=302449 RepID=UPI00123B4D9C|nr:WYL domain-containing protein [Corynebacterium tuscaniense]KAA8744652.1 WYL domain-containing protein [Corynebacterium tuscaniense]
MKKDSPEKITHLVRTLNLLPYLHKHPNATPMEIARDLGYSHTDVMEDFQRLMLSGVGKRPEELIDLAPEWTGVTVIDDQGMNAPLRLTPTEANALLLTLESLETMPGLIDHSAVTSAAQKIRDVMSDAGVSDAQHPDTPGALGTISEALAQRRMLRLNYYSATSDTTRFREVAPVGIFHRDGNTYLSAVEEGTAKTFRVDRIKEAVLIDDPVPASSTPGSPIYDATDPFGFGDAKVATLRIHPEATWLADFWQIELHEERDRGWVVASMPYGSDDWLVRFCLSQADRVAVTEPTHIAEKLAGRGKAGLERYA